MNGVKSDSVEAGPDCDVDERNWVAILDEWSRTSESVLTHNGD